MSPTLLPGSLTVTHRLLLLGALALLGLLAVPLQEALLPGYHVWTALAAALVLVAVGGALAVSILKPLRHNLTALESLVDGNLNPRLDLAGPEELVRQGKALATLAERLRQTSGAERVDWQELAAWRGRAGEFQAIIESTPSAILMADPDLRITYVNPAAFQALKSLQAYLPCRAEELVGQSIDIFHKNPAGPRRILIDPNNLPHKVTLPLGPEWLAARIDAIHDPDGRYLGPLLTWEVVTRQREQERLAQQADERERQRTGELKAKVDSLLEVVSAAARGELNRSVTVKGEEDPIDRLGSGLEQLLAALKDSIRGIGTVSDELGGASTQMSGISRQLAGNAEQASDDAQAVAVAAEQVSGQVEAVAAASEQMNTSLQEIARNTAQASDATQAVLRIVTEGGEAMARLRSRGEEIGDIVRLITAVAEQTNLLALNATIEAARAGEAGKGFAVVAGEVKELARRTAQATQDIDGKIGSIRSETRTTEEVMGRVRGSIDQLADLQNGVAGAVEEQTTVVAEITRNVAEAARGMNEIAGRTQQVANTVRETNLVTGQVSDTVQQLDRLAEELGRLTEHWRLTR